MELEQNIWWNNYVDTAFHSLFAKQCKRKFAIKYQIKIPGVPLSAFKSHVLCYENTSKNNGTNLHFVQFNNNTRIQTDTTNGYNDWLIDNIFNNGCQYIFKHARAGTEYSHYNDVIEWNQTQSQSLIVTGHLKKRVPGYPWTNL